LNWDSKAGGPSNRINFRYPIKERQVKVKVGYCTVIFRPQSTKFKDQAKYELQGKKPEKMKQGTGTCIHLQNERKQLVCGMVEIWGITL